jgi:hypothetical protein
MRLLVLDSISAAGVTLARDLTNELGHNTHYVSSAELAFEELESGRGAVGLIVFFLETTPDAGIDFVRKVREFCSYAAIPCPRFLVRTPGNLPPGYLRRFRALAAECVVCGFPKQLYATAKEMVFETICENGKPTIVAERVAHQLRFWILGPAGRELLAIGPRLFRLMNFFSINFGMELSTVQLAEAADLTLAYVRVYLNRLRQRFDEAAMNAGLTISGKDVFCTYRKDGGFVHVMRAKVLFI